MENELNADITWHASDPMKCYNYVLLCYTNSGEAPLSSSSMNLIDANSFLLSLSEKLEFWLNCKGFSSSLWISSSLCCKKNEYYKIQRKSINKHTGTCIFIQIVRVFLISWRLSDPGSPVPENGIKHPTSNQP